MSQQQKLGKKGEAIAKEFLLEQGYQILESNWRYRRTELDIIAKDGETLVFVEVKTRNNDYFARPEKAVDPQKEQRIIKTALAYMRKVNHEWAIRFDIIAIVKKGKDRYSIQHLKDAFFPS